MTKLQPVKVRSFLGRFPLLWSDFLLVLSGLAPFPVHTWLVLNEFYVFSTASVAGALFLSRFVLFSSVSLAPRCLPCTRARLQSRGGGYGEAQGSNDAAEQAIQRVAAFSAPSIF